MLRRRLSQLNALAKGDVRVLLNGSVWLLLAGAFGQGGMLVSSLLVGNLLGTANYGRYALIQTTIILLAGLAQVILM